MQSLIGRLARVIMLWITVMIAHSETLRVPLEYSTIQSAIDAAENGDTILVSVGIYEESLLLSWQVITLLGDVVADTGDYPRPVLDPTGLSDPLIRRCVTINGGSVTISDFVFLNGFRMYPRSGNNTGGIWNAGDSLVVRRCLFDSVYIPVFSPDAACAIENCIMRYSKGKCIDTETASLRLSDTWISGQGSWSLIECGARSEFSQSRIGDNHAGGFMVLASGGDHVFRDCLFENFGPTSEPVLWGWFGGSVIERCVFESCTTGGQLIMATNCDCGHPLVMRDNVFRFNGNAAGRGQGGNRVTVSCGDSINCYILDALNNTIVDASVLAGTKGINLSGLGQITRNRFERLLPPNSPAVKALVNGVECHENSFQDNGFAASAEANLGVSLDARFNWWGDSSGPRCWSNPSGLGDSAGPTVTVDPWYPDTSFWNDASERRPPIAKQVELQVFPNPFNDEATLRLVVSKPLILRLELFDMLGRRVQELWSGATALDKEFHIGGSDLSSGIYYVRAWDVLERRPLAIAKAVLVK